MLAFFFHASRHATPRYVRIERLPIRFFLIRHTPFRRRRDCHSRRFICRHTLLSFSRRAYYFFDIEMPCPD